MYRASCFNVLINQRDATLLINDLDYLLILIARTAKIIAKILRRRIERKIEDVLGEDQF